MPSHSWHWSAAEWLVCHEEDSVLCRKFHQLVLREVSGGGWVSISVISSNDDGHIPLTGEARLGLRLGLSGLFREFVWF